MSRSDSQLGLNSKDIVFAAIIYALFVSIRVVFRDSATIYSVSYYFVVNFMQFATIGVVISALALSKKMSLGLLFLFIPSSQAVFLLSTVTQSMTLADYVESKYVNTFYIIVLHSIGGAIASIIFIKFVLWRLR